MSYLDLDLRYILLLLPHSYIHKQLYPLQATSIAEYISSQTLHSFRRAIIQWQNVEGVYGVAEAISPCWHF
jgi:hypothetical protein